MVNKVEISECQDKIEARLLKEIALLDRKIDDLCIEKHKIIDNLNEYILEQIKELVREYGTVNEQCYQIDIPDGGLHMKNMSPVWEVHDSNTVVMLTSVKVTKDKYKRFTSDDVIYDRYIKNNKGATDIECDFDFNKDFDYTEKKILLNYVKAIYQE